MRDHSANTQLCDFSDGRLDLNDWRRILLPDFGIEFDFWERLVRGCSNPNKGSATRAVECVVELLKSEDAVLGRSRFPRRS